MQPHEQERLRTAGTPLDDAVVLILGDNAAHRHALARWLRGAGYQVREGATAAEGIAHARAGVDLVVVDVHLPDASGLDAARRLRADPLTAHVPILHVSAGHVTTADRVAGLDVGADGYLAHPVDPIELIATVRALLRLASVERALSQRTETAEAALKALADSEALFRTVQDTSLHGFGLHRPVHAADDPSGAIVDFDITYINPAGLRLVGRSSDAVLGRRVLDVFPGLAGSSILAGYVDAVATGVPFRCTFAAGSDGVDHSLEITAVRIGRASDAQLAVTFSDVSARLRADEEVSRLQVETQAARIEAESANKEKSDFLTHMSHELRTPLNAVGGYAQLLQLGTYGAITEEQHSTLARIAATQRHMLMLVNAVLDFATLNAGRTEYELADLDVAEVLSEVLAMVEPQRQAKAITLAVRLDVPELDDAMQPSCRVLADRDKLVQVLLNVIGNAVKFTPDGGHIVVERVARSDASDPPGVVYIRIADSGVGIPPDRLDAIFDPFVQAHRTAHRATGGSTGTGLGLAISRGLVRGMGGELRARSAVGTGSTFTVTLPGIWRDADSFERRDGQERRFEPNRRVPT